jgi:outer membrane protein
MKHSGARALVLSLCFVGLGAIPGRAQQISAPATSGQSSDGQAASSAAAQPSGLPPGVTTYDYSRSHAFPNIFAPYLPEPVPEPSLSNSELMHRLTRDGKLYLSLDDAIALAIENNLTIAVQRFNVPFAQLDYLRAKAGGAPRGVPGAFISNALFLGAVGAGLSSSASSGSGGGGAFATGGAVNIGSIACCDPIAGFSFGWSHSVTPLNFATVYGTATVGTEETAYSSFYGQGFLTGTSVAVGLSGNRQTSTSLSSIFNPEVPSGGFIGIDQNLLNGFGYRANAKFIRIARNDTKFADAAFRLQVMTTVGQVVNDYYTLLYDQENVRVAQDAVNYAEALLDDNKKQVEIGTLAPIEVVRAESAMATNQQTLIVAQTTLKQQAESLKTELSKQVGPDLEGIEISPTDKFPEPQADDVPTLEEALRLAYQDRPELTEADLNLSNQDITLKAVRNALLPTLTAFGSYTPSGLSGNLVCAEGTVLAACKGLPPGTLIGSAGITQSFTSLLHGTYPYYSYGLSLSIPIRNRQEQADAARALFEQRQLQTQLQQQKNTIAQDVRNAEIAITQAKAQIDATIKATELAKETLDADRKKFELGESTTFQLIQDQRDLTTAQGNEAKARQTYANAVTQVGTATGTLLDRYHVQMADAKNGRVSHPPNIPGSAQTPAAGRE